MDWNWQGQRFRTDSTQSVDVNNAYFRHDLWKRLYVQAGIMDPGDLFGNAGGNINLSQLPLGRIQGLRMGSTQAWLNPSGDTQGTPVSVFLARDARVDAYRGDQLLSSFYLNAGTQALDTRSFPAGSYTVTLRVHEDNQLVRTEHIFYTGTGAQAPNTFQWFLQAGSLDGQEAPEHGESRRVIQGGARFPLTRTAALTAGVSRISDASWQEGAVDWNHTFSGLLDGQLSTRASLLRGSDDARGNIQQVNYSDGFSLSFYRSEMKAPACSNQPGNRYSISGCYMNTSLVLSVPVSQWYTSIGYTLSSSEGRYIYRRDTDRNDPSHHTGAPWEQVYTSGSRSRSWQAGVTRAFSVGDISITGSLNTFMRTSSGYSGRDKGLFASFSLTRTGQSTGGSARSTATLGAGWQTSRQGHDQLSYTAAWSRYGDPGTENETGASLSGLGSDSLTASVHGRTGGRYGSGSLTLSDSRDRATGQHSPGGSGNYSSSLVVDRTGLQWGRWGDGTPSSAVVVSVASESETDGAVSVSMDTGGQADVSGLGQALFTVPGYRQSTFSIVESADTRSGTASEISRGAGSQTVFMAPGQVFHRGVDVTSHYTWLGRMMNENARPLKGGIPLNVMSWSSLGDGGFTVETTRKLNSLYVMRDGTFWFCRLKVRSVRDVVRYVGDTMCQMTTLANLPAAEQKQVSLMALNGQHEKDTPVAKNN